MEDKFGEAKLIIGAANVVCDEATLLLLIKTAFGRFNQLVFINHNTKVQFYTTQHYLFFDRVIVTFDLDALACLFQ